jgi:transketolase
MTKSDFLKEHASDGIKTASKLTWAVAILCLLTMLISIYQSHTNDIREIPAFMLTLRGEVENLDEELDTSLSKDMTLNFNNPRDAFMTAQMKLGLDLNSEIQSDWQKAAELLKEDGVIARVVSCPSEGLFRRQPKEYQETIIPRNAKVFALTAGLPVIFAELVGGNGKVYGLESFGFSAPFKVLDEKLGFTAENMRKEILSYLAE